MFDLILCACITFQRINENCWHFMIDKFSMKSKCWTQTSNCDRKFQLYVCMHEEEMNKRESIKLYLYLKQVSIESNASHFMNCKISNTVWTVCKCLVYHIGVLLIFRTIYRITEWRKVHHWCWIPFSVIIFHLIIPLSIKKFAKVLLNEIKCIRHSVWFDSTPF